LVIARRLAALGAAIVIADLDEERAADAASRIEAAGGLSEAVAADVCDRSDRNRILERAERLGAVQILINNAGGWGTADRRFPYAEPQEWGAVIDLNLLAPMTLLQQCLEPMHRAGGGVAVNVASSAGWQQRAYESPEYAVAKAGLIRLTTALADLAQTHRVRVNCVVPNWIGLTRAYTELAEMPLAQREATPPLIPPDEVADAVEQFIRDDRMTGRLAILEGGTAARIF
jgi:3-oxoacyl-[acyl-carrier protein] reductase